MVRTIHIFVDHHKNTLRPRFIRYTFLHAVPWRSRNTDIFSLKEKLVVSCVWAVLFRNAQHDKSRLDFLVIRLSRLWISRMPDRDRTDALNRANFSRINPFPSPRQLPFNERAFNGTSWTFTIQINSRRGTSRLFEPRLEGTAEKIHFLFLWFQELQTLDLSFEMLPSGPTVSLIRTGAPLGKNTRMSSWNSWNRSVDLRFCAPFAWKTISTAPDLLKAFPWNFRRARAAGARDFRDCRGYSYSPKRIVKHGTTDAVENCLGKFLVLARAINRYLLGGVRFSHGFLRVRVIPRRSWQTFPGNPTPWKNFRFKLSELQTVIAYLPVPILTRIHEKFPPKSQSERENQKMWS